MLDAVAIERERWEDQGLLIDPAGSSVDTATAAALARETGLVLSRLSGRALGELREREAKDARRRLRSDDVLRCAMFGVASEAWVSVRVGLPEPEASRAHKLATAELLIGLREAALGSQRPEERAGESRDHAVDTVRVIDECVRGFRAQDRGWPYLVFAALSDPDSWSSADTKRSEFLVKLLYLGEESQELGGCVLLALSRPLSDGLGSVRDPDARVASHLAGISRGTRTIGFEKQHLDVALDIRERAERDDSDLGGFRREYAGEIVRRVRDELEPPLDDGLRIADPKAEIEAWKMLAHSLPWPELKRRAEVFLRAIATDEFTHPNDEALAALAEQRARGEFSSEQNDQYRGLRSKRYLDVRETLLGMLMAVEAALPAEQALEMQYEFGRSLHDHGKDSLRDGVVAHSLERSFVRSPLAAKDLLDRAVLENRMEQDPFVHRVAIEALISGETAVSGGRETAIKAALESLDPSVRCAALSTPAYLTEDESERLVTKSIEDLLGHPAFAKGDARSELSLGVVSHISLRASQGEEGRSWASRMAFRSLESGLWQEERDAAMAPELADSFAAALTPEQVNELEAIGKLPTWVKEHRGKP